VGCPGGTQKRGKDNPEFTWYKQGKQLTVSVLEWYCHRLGCSTGSRLQREILVSKLVDLLFKCGVRYETNELGRDFYDMISCTEDISLPLKAALERYRAQMKSSDALLSPVENDEAVGEMAADEGGGEGEDDASQKKKRKKKKKVKSPDANAHGDATSALNVADVANSSQDAPLVAPEVELTLHERLQNKVNWLQGGTSVDEKENFKLQGEQCVLQEAKTCILCENRIDACACLGTQEYIIQSRRTTWDDRYRKQDSRLHVAVLAQRAKNQQLYRTTSIGSMELVTPTTPLNRMPSPVKGKDPALIEPHLETMGDETSQELIDDGARGRQPSERPHIPLVLSDAPIVERLQTIDEGISLDGLAWEVLIGPAAKETLFSKKLGEKLSKAALRKLQELARGNWSSKMAKRLEGVPSWLNNQIFETYLTSAFRIIWQKAIDFSPMKKTYTDTIRVWYIEMDHDNVPKKVENIVRSLKRGRESHVKKALRRRGHNTVEDTDGVLVVPNIYHPDELEIRDENDLEAEEGQAAVKLDGKKDDSQKHYFPPAEVGPTNNYTILKFYSMSREFVKSVLWCAAHEKLEVPTSFPFCADEREDYFIKLMPDPPKSMILVGRSGTGKTTISLHRMWALYHSHQEKIVKKEIDPTTTFNQVFITANTVLRSQVEKSFRSLQGQGSWNPNVEKATLNLNQVKQEEFPLFLTSKEWLAALDLCVTGDKFLTEAELADKGSWFESGDPLERLELEDDDDYDDFDGDLPDDTGVINTGEAGRRRKVTFQFFVEHLWPSMTQRAKSRYSASSVYTEIFSYIKGSFESLASDNGRLTCEEYINLPKKMASVFRGDMSEGFGSRKEVYELYEKYEQAKAVHHAYDTADMVTQIFQRIQV